MGEGDDLLHSLIHRHTTGVVLQPNWAPSEYAGTSKGIAICNTFFVTQLYMMHNHMAREQSGC